MLPNMVKLTLSHRAFTSNRTLYQNCAKHLTGEGKMAIRTQGVRPFFTAVNATTRTPPGSHVLGYREGKSDTPPETTPKRACGTISRQRKNRKSLLSSESCAIRVTTSACSELRSFTTRFDFAGHRAPHRKWNRERSTDSQAFPEI
jgi:hypothetical protein